MARIQGKGLSQALLLEPQGRLLAKVDGATVTITTDEAGLVPAAVYAEETGPTTVTQPLTSVNGVVLAVGGGDWWLEPGVYWLHATLPDDRELHLRIDAYSGVDAGRLTTVEQTTLRTANAADPINREKIRISLSNYASAEADLDVNLTTPETSRVLVHEMVTTDELVSPVPGNYEWGIGGYLVNLGNAPVTPVWARARGRKVYPLSSSGRAFGKDPQIHGIEFTAGIFPSIATATANGTSTLNGPTVAQDDLGSRFEAGMPVTMTGAGTIPGGTTIASVAGPAGAPTSITLSNPVTGSGVVVLTALAVTRERIGILGTGNGSTVDNPDPPGAAFQVQSTNAYSHFQYGVNIGASGLQAAGIGFRLSSVIAARGLSIESAALAEGIEIVNTAVSNALIELGAGNTGNYGIRFASDFVPGIATIYLPGGSGPHYASIGTDTTFGFQICTNVNMKWAAHGRTPVAIATITGSRGGATVTVLADLLTALHNKGIITNSTTA